MIDIGKNIIERVRKCIALESDWLEGFAERFTIVSIEMLNGNGKDPHG